MKRGTIVSVPNEVFGVPTVEGAERVAERYLAMRRLPASLFTVEELDFLMRADSSRVSEYTLARVDAIYKRIRTEPLPGCDPAPFVC